MNGISKLPALIKREVLEQPNLWRVPLILIGIAVLVRIAMVVGNLSFNLNMPEQLQLDDELDLAVNAVVSRALNQFNVLIMVVMFVVAIFYSLTGLYNERQDNSVLFWRSLPISDSMTVASKLIVALIAVPLLIVISQVVVAAIFLGADAVNYLLTYFGSSLLNLGKIVLWSMLPVVAWCMLCSSVASKNPFLLAFIAPILFVSIDKLFLDGNISQILVIDRLASVGNHTLMPLIWGLATSAVCITLAIIKRSQRF